MFDSGWMLISICDIGSRLSEPSTGCKNYKLAVMRYIELYSKCVFVVE